MRFKFHVGDEVWDTGDPRHLGHIVAIRHSTRADIIWNDTGWKSLDVPVKDLRKYDHAGRVISEWYV